MREAGQWMLHFKPKALPNAMLGVPKALPAAASVAGAAKKVTPAVGFNPLQLSKHLAKNNPAQAIQAGRQYGAKVMGSKNVLDELSRTSFDKLSVNKSH